MKVLIVDDEAHARKGLRTMLSSTPGMEVVGEAVNGLQAVEAIASLKPDLVLLDVEMPELNGLGVIERVGVENMPMVVMITAYDQYAIEAFEVAAVDYLLKPFTNARFHAAMARAREAHERESIEVVGQRLRHMLGTMGQGRSAVERFTVKTGDSLAVFRVDEIDWIEADQYYAHLHIGGESHMIRQTMSALEDMLPADRFVRIHRSTIVNVARIVALEPLFQGDHTVVLKDGTRLKMSRRRKELLNTTLKSLG